MWVLSSHSFLKTQLHQYNQVSVLLYFTGEILCIITEYVPTDVNQKKMEINGSGKCVCILHIKPRSFYPSTSSTTSVRDDFSIAGEIQTFCGHIATPQRCVCVSFTLNRSFYPSTSSTTSVRADSSILEEIQVMWSQILPCHVCSNYSSGQCRCRVIIQDTTGTTYTFDKMEKRTKTIKDRNQNKQDKSKQKMNMK